MKTINNSQYIVFLVHPEKDFISLLVRAFVLSFTIILIIKQTKDDTPLPSLIFLTATMLLLMISLILSFRQEELKISFRTLQKKENSITLNDISLIEVNPSPAYLSNSWRLEFFSFGRGRLKITTKEKTVIYFGRGIKNKEAEEIAETLRALCQTIDNPIHRELIYEKSMTSHTRNNSRKIWGYNLRLSRRERRHSLPHLMLSDQPGYAARLGEFAACQRA